MMTETIYLIEVTASTGTVYRFCSGIGYVSLPGDTPANACYQPRVDQPGLFRQNMFSVGTTSGASSGGYGEISLINTDGALDNFVDLGFDGQLCVVKEGHPGAALASFSTVITGTIEQCELSWSRVTFRLKDKTALLNTPVQPLLYLGNNALPDGREGGTELKDKPKPRLFGNCTNITPVCVNTSKLIYQVNSGPVYDITAVHDGGNVGQIVKGTDYATGALLEAATMPAATNPPTAPGAYHTCLAEGLFRLDAAPFMQITCDVIQGTTSLSDAADRTPARIIRALAIEKLGAEYVAEQPLIDLNQSAYFVVGYYTGTNVVNTSTIFDALCPSAGAWWGFDNLGIFWAKQLTAPDVSQSVMTLTQAEILSIDRTATADGDKGVPVYRVNIDFAKNWTVQTSGLAGSVAGNQLTFEPDNAIQLTTDRKNMLAMEYLRLKKEDLTVKATHLLSPEITIQTTLDSPSAANSEAERVLNMRKVRRDRLNIKAPSRALQYPAGGYWDDEAISEMPEGRYQASAIMYGNYVYIMGGYSTVGGLASVIRLNVASNPSGAWDDAGVTDLPLSRSGHTLETYNGYIYVIGGTYAAPIASVIRLNVASNPAGAWDDAGVTNLPQARTIHGSTQYGGYIYVVGGMINFEMSSSVIRLNVASNPSGAWDDAGVTDLPAVRQQHQVVQYNGYIYVIGGQFDGNIRTASVIRLNVASNPAGAWDDAGVTNLPYALCDFTAAVSPDGYLYVLGGFSTSPVYTVIRLNLNNPTGAWEYISAMPSDRQMPSAVFCNASLYMFGGFTLSSQSNTWRLRQNSIPEDASQKTSLGRTVLVKYPRYGYTSGRPMKIIGAETDLKNRIMTLELWG